MSWVGTDLTYLVARLHGRRGRIIERERLDALCRLRSLPELCQALARDPATDAATLERQLTDELIEEHWALARARRGREAELLTWMLARYLLENLELALRCRAGQVAREGVKTHLVALPAALALDVDAVLRAETPKELVRALGNAPACAPFAPLLGARRSPLRYLEGSLEQAYLRELLVRAERLPGEDGLLCQSLMAAEADIFHLMLVVRGRYHHAFGEALLLSLHVAGTSLAPRHLRAMLREPDLASAARHAVGRALERLPPEAAELTPPSYAALLETLAWSRYEGLARRTFRRSPGGMAAVVGYLAQRRVETTNLRRVAAGLGRVPPEALRAHLLPYDGARSAHV